MVLDIERKVRKRKIDSYHAHSDTFLSFSGQITSLQDPTTNSKSTKPDDHEFFNLLEQVLQILFCDWFFVTAI